MSYMSTAADRRDGWAERGRRIAARPHAPAVGVGLLGLASVAEAVARIAGIHASPMSVTFSLLIVSLLALCTTLPLLFPDPVAATAVITAANVLSLANFDLLTAAAVVAQLVALYRMGRGGGRLPAPAVAAPFVVLALIGAWPADSENGFLTVLLAALAPATAWAGIAQRARGEARVHNAARQSIAQSLFEHTARGERARIVRELHDVVAHHISMIAVQAETARLTTPGMPPAGAQRLSEIGDTARAGLTEMRRLLGVLREDAGAEIGQRHPQPGLRQLNELIDEARGASGAAARLIVRGAPATLDQGVELAAYRIVQEALTNARRHAPGAAVDVELHYTDEALLLRIRDNGPGLEAAQDGQGAQDRQGGGHGLPGMRERATAAGGELRTGHAPGGGFLIEATLPAKAQAAL
jgi:signal transduction histidine kinase